MASSIVFFLNPLLALGFVSRSLINNERPINPFVACSWLTMLSKVTGVVKPINDKKGFSSPLSIFSSARSNIGILRFIAPLGSSFSPICFLHWESSAVNARVSELDDRERKLAKTQALKEIKDAHKDFDNITNSQDFHDWAKTQPKGIQEWIYNNPTNSALAIRAIDLYKADVGKIEADNESTNQVQVEVDEAASLVSTKPSEAHAPEGKKIWTEQESHALTADQYARLEAEIDEAMFEGRVVPG